MGNNIANKEHYLALDQEQAGLSLVGRSLTDGCLTTGLFSDILFKLDDGTLPAHKQTNLKRARWWRQDFSEQGSAVINKL